MIPFVALFLWLRNRLREEKAYKNLCNKALLRGVLCIFPVILVRGLCVPHAGYGFLVGYFYGKGLKSGQPGVKWIGFIVAWLLHGMYDFSLSQEFLAINDNLAIAALLLAVAEVVLVIVLIRFALKARKQSVYLEPLAMDR